MRRCLFLLFFSCLVWAQPPVGGELQLPLKSKSVRFAVIGDGGTGEKAQFDVAAQMARFHAMFPFDFVLMLGDNIYGGKGASGFKRKFEDPYRPLLDAGVKFYASLGNHDDPSETLYKPFNMGGKRYYSVRSGNVHLLALDSNYMDPQQLGWIDQQIPDNENNWKICFFHHPFYDHARFHGPDLDLRAHLEPLLEKKGVNVVLAGHEHIYERIKPQHGIYYFVLGNSGQLRANNLRASPEIDKGFDTDQCFMMMEVAGDELYFQTVSRTGKTVDSGVLQRQKAAAATAAAGSAPAK